MEQHPNIIILGLNRKCIFPSNTSDAFFDRISYKVSEINKITYFLEPPTIINEDSIHYAVEGDLVIKIPCDVTGYPEPIIVWNKGGKALNIGENIHGVLL